MRKILIVEDESTLRDSYELILSTEPYEIRAATNGAEALRLCKETAFDLILLDLMMPIMNGIEFLKQYLKDADKIPKIVVLSNLSSGEELNAALKLGAHKNFVKSNLSPRQLVSMVRYELQS